MRRRGNDPLARLFHVKHPRWTRPTDSLPGRTAWGRRSVAGFRRPGGEAMEAFMEAFIVGAQRARAPRKRPVGAAHPSRRGKPSARAGSSRIHPWRCRGTIAARLESASLSAAFPPTPSGCIGPPSMSSIWCSQPPRGERRTGYRWEWGWWVGRDRRASEGRGVDSVGHTRGSVGATRPIADP